jgi:hypothetical protein
MAKLLAHVLSSGSDCTNNGITSKYKQLMLCTTKEEAEELYKKGEPALWVEVKGTGENKLIRAFPPYDKDAGCVGWMAGGNFVYTPHSGFEAMFGTSQPIKVLDRQETQTYYNSTAY